MIVFVPNPVCYLRQRATRKMKLRIQAKMTTEADRVFTPLLRKVVTRIILSRHLSPQSRTHRYRGEVVAAVEEVDMDTEDLTLKSTHNQHCCIESLLNNMEMDCHMIVYRLMTGPLGPLIDLECLDKIHRSGNFDLCVQFLIGFAQNGDA